jgi:hypothetical protein
MQAALPYSVFVAGYAHTVSNRLVLADDEGPNGAPVDHVFIDLHAVMASCPTPCVQTGTIRLSHQCMSE